MTKEEFVAKLQMVYVGDKNAFNELVDVYSNLLKKNDEAIEYLEKFVPIDNDTIILRERQRKYIISILQYEEVKDDEERLKNN